jgi:hypothetical protein
MTFGREKEMIPLIQQLSRQAKSVEEAIDLIQAMLAGQIGGATLLIEPLDRGLSPYIARAISSFMDSRAFPFRGFYTIPLKVRGKNAGRLIACFGTFGAPENFLPRLSTHIATALGEVLGRVGTSNIGNLGAWHSDIRDYQAA